MGRKKLEIKRIEDKSSRQVTFSKRRGGLIKKARELSILCEADVALFVFSSRGKLFQFSSSPSVSQIIQRYNNHCESQEMVSADGTQTESRFGGFLTSSELLDIIQRELEDPHVDWLTVNDLILIEGQIDDTLSQIRKRKTQLMFDSVTALHEKEKLLQEENKHLANELDAMKINRKNTRKGISVDLNCVYNHIDSSAPGPTLQLI